MIVYIFIGISIFYRSQLLLFFQFVYMLSHIQENVIKYLKDCMLISIKHILGLAENFQCLVVHILNKVVQRLKLLYGFLNIFLLNFQYPQKKLFLCYIWICSRCLIREKTCILPDSHRTTDMTFHPH